MPDRPEHDDPERYAALSAFDTGYRELWWNADFLELSAQRWATNDAHSVLDVGCGSGDWGRTVIRRMAPHATLTGVDRVGDFLDRAKEHARPSDAFVTAQAQALPFDDDQFDIVTCQTVLIHVPDPAAVIAEMKRVTRPGGLVLVVEPDNLAGNLALLGGSPAMSDADIVEITALMVACQRGKANLGEGDERIGGRLPGLLAAAGLDDVAAHVNDRCISLVPPYQSPDMALSLEQERAWSEEDVSIVIGARPDALRLAMAADYDLPAFERGWAALRRWMASVAEGTRQRTYHATRGFMMVMAGGRA